MQIHLKYVLSSRPALITGFDCAIPGEIPGFEANLRADDIPLPKTDLGFSRQNSSSQLITRFTKLRWLPLMNGPSNRTPSNGS
jgi:hypothetical protein